MDEAKKLAYIRSKFGMNKNKPINRVQFIGDAAYIVYFDDGTRAVGSVAREIPNDNPIKSVANDLRDEVERDQFRQAFESQKSKIFGEPISREKVNEILRMMNPMMTKHLDEDDDYNE